jgi:hypothetical protein
MKITVDELLALMREVDQGDPQDWSQLNVSQAQAQNLVALNIVDQYNNTWQKLDTNQQILSLLATMAHLVVENFALNLRLSSET